MALWTPILLLHSKQTPLTNCNSMITCGGSVASLLHRKHPEKRRLERYQASDLLGTDPPAIRSGRLIHGGLIYTDTNALNGTTERKWGSGQADGQKDWVQQTLWKPMSLAISRKQRLQTNKLYLRIKPWRQAHMRLGARIEKLATINERGVYQPNACRSKK
jgi:hypothetical protein